MCSWDGTHEQSPSSLAALCGRAGDCGPPLRQRQRVGRGGGWHWTRAGGQEFRRAMGGMARGALVLAGAVMLVASPGERAAPRSSLLPSAALDARLCTEQIAAHVSRARARLLARRARARWPGDAHVRHDDTDADVRVHRSRVLARVHACVRVVVGIGVAFFGCRACPHVGTACGSVIPTGATLSWRDLSYSVHTGAGKEKHILKNIHGSAEPGLCFLCADCPPVFAACPCVRMRAQGALCCRVCVIVQARVPTSVGAPTRAHAHLLARARARTGRLVAMMGPTGSGKTSLLNLPTP